MTLVQFWIAITAITITVFVFLSSVNMISYLKAQKIKNILVEKSLGFLKQNYTNLRISDVESAESKGVFDLNSILLKLFTT
jgi:hypothetical protein